MKIEIEFDIGQEINCLKVGDIVVNLNVHWTGIIKEIEKWGPNDFYLVHYDNGSDYWEEERSLTKNKLFATVIKDAEIYAREKLKNEGKTPEEIEKEIADWKYRITH